MSTASPKAERRPRGELSFFQFKKNLQIFQGNEVGPFLNLLASATTHLVEGLIPPRSVNILVGDSGERDPEVYAAILRKHPEQIEKILIRSIPGEGSDDLRYRRAFDGIDAKRWQSFSSPSEITLAP